MHSENENNKTWDWPTYSDISKLDTERRHEMFMKQVELEKVIRSYKCIEHELARDIERRWKSGQS